MARAALRVATLDTAPSDRGFFESERVASRVEKIAAVGLMGYLGAAVASFISAAPGTTVCGVAAGIALATAYLTAKKLAPNYFLRMNRSAK